MKMMEAIESWERHQESGMSQYHGLLICEIECRRCNDQGWMDLVTATRDVAQVGAADLDSMFERES